MFDLHLQGWRGRSDSPPAAAADRINELYSTITVTLNKIKGF